MTARDPTTACPPDIDRLLADDTPEPLRTALETHLAECPDCRRRLDGSPPSGGGWNALCRRLREPADTTPHGPGPGIDDAVARTLELLAPTDDPDALGRLGPYEFTGVVGAGGMGVVLKGHDRSLNRYAALKVLAPHLAGSGAARKRFAREAQAAAAVVHENVIEIYGVDETGPLPYLAMRYVRGGSLEARLRRRGPLSATEVLRVGVQVARGLAAAHGQGLVHRDIKPANILQADDSVERVVLSDFGLARAADDARLTRSQVIVGTPLFMSPEQATGEPADHRSDLFSLGSLLYTLCTGHPPFEAETSYGVLRRITDSQPPPIQDRNPTVPDWLCRVIANLLAKAPADRWQSAAEVADLLAGCLAHVQRPHVDPLPTAVPPAPQTPFRPWRTVMLTTVLTLTAAVGGWALMPDPAPAAPAAKPLDQSTKADVLAGIAAAVDRVETYEVTLEYEKEVTDARVQNYHTSPDTTADEKREQLGAGSHPVTHRKTPFGPMIEGADSAAGSAVERNSLLGLSLWHLTAGVERTAADATALIDAELKFVCLGHHLARSKSWRIDGTETVGGLECLRLHVTAPHGHEYIVWIAPARDWLPVKMTDAQGDEHVTAVTHHVRAPITGRWLPTRLEAVWNDAAGKLLQRETITVAALSINGRAVDLPKAPTVAD